MCSQGCDPRNSGCEAEDGIRGSCLGWSAKPLQEGVYAEPQRMSSLKLTGEKEKSWVCVQAEVRLGKGQWASKYEKCRQREGVCVVISAEHKGQRGEMQLEKQAGTTQEGQGGSPCLQFGLQSNGKSWCISAKGYKAGRDGGQGGDMKEMKTREEETSSETFNKPRKTQRWFEFPSDLPHHLWTAGGTWLWKAEGQKRGASGWRVTRTPLLAQWHEESLHRQWTDRQWHWEKTEGLLNKKIYEV